MSELYNVCVCGRKISVNRSICMNCQDAIDGIVPEQEDPVDQFKAEAKKIVKENISKYLTETGQDDIVFTNPVDSTFKLYKKTRIRTDKANFSGGACKFIYDALVELSILVDDNDDWILTEQLLETEHDKENPRVVLTFKERINDEHI